jgi:hypothetical protein
MTTDPETPNPPGEPISPKAPPEVPPPSEPMPPRPGDPIPGQTPPGPHS